MEILISLFVLLSAIYVVSYQNQGSRGNVEEIYFNGSTYFVIPRPVTWDKAKEWCRKNKNGTLAILDTSEKRMNIVSIPPNISQKNFWVGMSGNGSGLKWVDERVAVLDIKLYQKPANGRRCFYISQDKKFFKKRRCGNNTNMGLICEIGPSSPSFSNVSNVTCFNGSKYIAITEPETWYNAKKWCQNNKNGTLAILDTPEKRSFVKNKLLTNTNYTKFWIGLQKNLRELKWVDGTNAALDKELHQIRSSGKSRCFYVKQDKPFFKKRDCEKNESMGFICEVRPPSASFSALETKTTYLPYTSQVNQTPSAVHVATTTEVYLSSTATKVDPTTSIYHSMYAARTTPLTSTVQVDHSSSTMTYLSSTKTKVYPNTSIYHSMYATPATPLTSTARLNHLNQVKHFREVMSKLNASDPDSMEVLLKEYDNLIKGIDQQNDEMDYNPLTEAQSIEKIALQFTQLHLNENKTSMNISHKEIAFHAKLVPPDIDSDVVFPDASEDPDLNTISLPKSLFQGREKTYIVIVMFKNNKTISEIAPKVMEGEIDKKKWIVNTEIFSTNIFPRKKGPFEEDVLIKLHHNQNRKIAKDDVPHCSFWNYTIPTSYNGSWSRRGCDVVSTTDTYTVCACNHLTNFAVLMQITPDEKPDKLHQNILSFITYIGLALSLLGEVITILLNCIFLNKRHEKIQIRVNLLCSLAAAQIVFLAGIDQIQNKNVCVFVAAIIHFFYLASFCWMMMEGVYLYRMVVKVFDAHMTMRYCYLFAYGFPLSVVVVSLLIATFQSEGIFSYISPKYCWFGFHNRLIWSFVGPVLLLEAVNSFFLFSVMKEMVSMRSVKTLNSFELSSIRASARACVVLLPLLGITWVFGLLSLGGFGVEWQYVFTVLNTTQGFMIFLFHCVRNTELRAAIELRYFQWESNHSIHSNRGRVTPSKNMNALAIDDSDKGRSNSIPMTTKENKVMPEPNAL